MRQRNLIVLAAALFVGLLAVLILNSVFSGVEDANKKAAEDARVVQIVVASQEMAFGTPVSPQNVKLASWPANSVPAGAFTNLEDATRARVALRPIVIGEPILASKVSGANGRAVLSANLPAGQLAFAVPVDPVSGAGGFIRPGDVVDVLVTRQIPGKGAGANDKMTDVVLEAVPVLGVDQVSDENKTEPALAKTATLQVDSFGAQKLALAQQLGVLTLALRNVADTNTGGRGTVTGKDITASRLYIPDSGNSAPRPMAARPALAYRVPARAPATTALPPVRTGPSMTVVRGTKVSDVGVYYAN